ncbi:MAG: alpha-mannosidase, partial [Armatimonadota bacterium]
MSSDSPVLHAIGNSHIDPVWLWRWNEGLESIRSTFRSALDRLNEYPDFVFTTSSAAFFDQLEHVEPEMLEDIKARVKEGRWEIVGGWWVEPDCNIPCGESLVRQALYGQTYFQKTFGVMAKIGFNPDTFGHPGTLPQILEKAGLDYYAFLRPMQNEKILDGPVFRWRSVDGSEVLASRIERAYCTWFDDETQLEEHVQINHNARPSYLKDYTVWYGVGNHGGGPTKKNLDVLAAHGDKEPVVKLSSLNGYFESIERELKSAEVGIALPEVTEELQHHARGCYSVHSEVKRLNRKTEHLLITAEKFASVACALLGREYPLDKLTSAWHGLLYNQFHDILAGSSLSEGYDDARDLYGHSRTIGAAVLEYSLQA